MRWVRYLTRCGGPRGCCAAWGYAFTAWGYAFAAWGYAFAAWGYAYAAWGYAYVAWGYAFAASAGAKVTGTCLSGADGGRCGGREGKVMRTNRCLTPPGEHQRWVRTGQTLPGGGGEGRGAR